MIKKITLILLLLIFTANLFADDSLFYIGEDTDVITITSGRPENPKKAPSSNKIINDFSTYTDFKEVLRDIPGFYIEDTNQRQKLYFRGISDSILFLYDGVPITSDVTRSIVPLDNEMNINNFSKLEVVYGASSVLWGADAFAGVMNTVVKRGKDIKGVNIDIFGNSFNRDKGFFIQGGNVFKNFDGMFSFYYRNREKKLNTDYAKDSYYYEFVSKIYFGKNLNLTIRLADNKNRFINNYKNFKWNAEKSQPFNLVKLEYTKSFNHSSVDIKGYYLDMDFDNRENGFKIKQKNKVYFGGLTYNKDFWNNSAMFTLGYSFRKNKIEDSDVFVRSFIPDYVLNKTSFSPLIDTANFTSNLNSFFLQLRKHFKNIELWGGVRRDIHSKYDDSSSFNVGIGYFKDKFTLKLNYGLSYRTPLPEVFVRESNIKPDKVYNINIEGEYNFSKSLTVDLMVFRNRLQDLIFENNYAGYSDKLSTNIYGIETEIKGDFFKTFHYYINFTAILNKKLKDEKYRTLDYIILKPDFSIEKFYKNYSKSLDIGAKRTGNAGLLFTQKKYKIFFAMNYIGDRMFCFLPEDKKIKIGNKFIFNTGVNLNIFNKLEININFENIFNTGYRLSGIYEPEEIKPFNVMIGVKYHF